MGNCPIGVVDRDGKFVHIIIGAAIGGLVNLAVKAYQGKIHSWGDGFAAFGIGAVAGAVGAATGGAAFLAAGGAVGGAGGFLAGFAAGAVGSAFSMPIQSLGNAAYFGDPLMTPREYAGGILIGGLLGGAVNGGIALGNGRTFWNGGYGKPSFIPSVEGNGSNLSRLKLVDDPEVQLQAPKGDLGRVTPNSVRNTTQLPDNVRLNAGDFGGKNMSVEQLKLNAGAQGKHILGNNNYLPGRSILTSDPNQLLNSLNSGNFTAVGTTPRGMPIVKFGQIIGTVIDQSGANLGPTEYAVIHIGKNGIHIVPWLP
jgi:hypothetical protein